MSIRLIVTITAVPGKGDELAAIYEDRCAIAMKEPGCIQFEPFQSLLDPDKLVAHEHWQDQAALTAHMKVIESRPPLPAGLRIESQREDYEYNRTR